MKEAKVPPAPCGCFHHPEQFQSTHSWDLKQTKGVVEIYTSNLRRDIEVLTSKDVKVMIRMWFFVQTLKQQQFITLNEDNNYVSAHQ